MGIFLLHRAQRGERTLARSSAAVHPFRTWDSAWKRVPVLVGKCFKNPTRLLPSGEGGDTIFISAHDLVLISRLHLQHTAVMVFGW